jgi:hypothetical protein
MEVAPMSTFGDPRLPRKFWDLVEPRANGCWIYFGGYTGDGYGAFYLTKKQDRVHRLAFAHLVRPIESGESIVHTCGDRRCVNIKHLYAKEVRRAEKAGSPRGEGARS